MRKIKQKGEKKIEKIKNLARDMKVGKICK